MLVPSKIKDDLSANITAANSYIAGAGSLTTFSGGVIYIYYISHDVIRVFLSILLFLVTFWRYQAYISAVTNELEILSQIFDTKKIRKMYNMRLVPYIAKGLGIAMFGMLVGCMDIFWYSMAAFVFGLIDVAGQSLTLKNIGMLLFSSAQDEKATPEFRKIVIDYYFMHNLVGRNAIVMTIFLASFMISTYGWVVAINSPLKDYCYYAAYAVAIMNVVVGELIVGKWRGKFEQDLEKEGERVSALENPLPGTSSENTERTNG